MADTKSKTIYLELPAIFEWAKVFPENKDTVGANNALVGTGGAYTVDLILTKDIYQQLEDAGSQKSPSVLNKDGKWMAEAKWRSKEQGKSFMDAFDEAETVKVKLVRKHDAPYTYGGPPQVAHADGTPWSLQDDGLIGNGSKGIAYVSVYEAGGLKGTRLDGLQIMELVEPPAREDDGDYEPRAFKIPNRTKGVNNDTPTPQVQPAKKVTPATKKAMIDDEIPF